MIGLAVVLGVAAVVAVAALAAQRHNLRAAVQDLARINRTGTDQRLRLTEPDREMERLFEEINRLVDQKKEQTAAYERREQELRQEIANISHDLRTPLTSIRGYIELLSSGKRDEQTARQFYEIIEIEAQRLANLIDDLLELSSIEQANTRPKAEPVSVADTVREVFEQVAPMAQKMEVALQSDIQEGLTVTMTHKHLQEFVMNLTDNAVKYNRPGGRVTVHGRQEAGNIVISVSDTGIGIPPESVDRIFERFYRVDKGRSRELGGTGLGLSIVKHIAGLYGGSVRVDSTLGQGTVFTVCLPAEE